MKLLLDTHALIWWWTDAPQLSPEVRRILSAGDNEIFVSAACIWEIATKWRIGKLREIADPASQYAPLMTENGFVGLALTEEHAMKAGLLAGEHRDPFDRMIAAQALIEGLSVITRDPALAAFGCDVIW